MNNSNIRLKDDTETYAGGFTMPITGEGGSCSFYAPAGTTSITITGCVPCLGGDVEGTVRVGGQTINYTIVGLSGGSTTINLPMSGVNVTVTGNTYCPATNCPNKGGVTVVMNSGTKK